MNSAWIKNIAHLLSDLVSTARLVRAHNNINTRDPDEHSDASENRVITNRDTQLRRFYSATILRNLLEQDNFPVSLCMIAHASLLSLAHCGVCNLGMTVANDIASQ